MTNKKIDAEDNFTPTQELIIELLIARTRLGENVWTFSNRFTKTVEQLTERGYVEWKSASVYGYILVWFTEESKEVFLSFPYQAPILEKYKLKRKFKNI